MTDDTAIYRVPVDAHGTVFVEAESEDEAFDIAREHARPSNSNMNMSVGESYRERVRAVEDPDHTPINRPGASVPEFGTVADLRRVRKRLGLSQRAVADALGLSPKTVSHYETGNREISLSTARDYAHALRIYAAEGGDP